MKIRLGGAFLVVAPAVLTALVSGRASAQAVTPLPPAQPAQMSPASPNAMPPPVVVDPSAIPPVEAAPAVPPLPTPSPAEFALTRVLRSGCRDGLEAVREHSADPAAPWAPTVTRLCSEILVQEGMPRGRQVSGGNEGRGRLVLWSAAYGIWLGIATDILFEIDGERSVIVAPLLGMGAGLGLSLAATSNFQLTVGEAYTIITGLDYGSFNGALWAGGFDLNSKGVVGATVATSIAATSVGVLVANTKSPSAGDIEVVRSGLLWGTVGGFLTTTLIGPSLTNDISPQSLLKLTALSMDAGFLAGVAFANYYDLSKNRVLMIDAGALAGLLAGVGIAWLVAGSNSEGQVISGAGLAGMLGGIGVAAYATRNLDADNVGIAAAPTVPALFSRDAAGRWGGGTPGPVPVFDGTGTRLVGATLSAVGGVF